MGRKRGRQIGFRSVESGAINQLEKIDFNRGKCDKFE